MSKQPQASKRPQQPKGPQFPLQGTNMYRWLLIVFGLAFYLVFGVLRPLLRDLVKPPEHLPQTAPPAGQGGELRGMPGSAPETVYTDALTKVKEFTKANPKVTADIVKEWMAKE